MSKNNDNRIILPEPTIRRLPWYLSYVRMLDNMNIEYVSSTQISNELNVQSSQIAKDLSFLNIRGKTRIGYEGRSLVTELEDFLGFNQHHDAVVIGTGSLGTALMQDHGLEHYGLNIVAGFDVRDEVIGKQLGGIPVFSISELESWQGPHSHRHSHRARRACPGSGRPGDCQRRDRPVELHALPHQGPRERGDRQHLDICPLGHHLQPDARTDKLSKTALRHLRTTR